jgi:diguanylate cyclase (GGDEF)-like protein
MSRASGNPLRRGLLVAAAWLLALFFIGVLAATRTDVDEVAVRLHALAGSQVSSDGTAVLLPGDRGRVAVASLRFTLPAPDATQSRWVVWLDRDPVVALWLQGPGWRSPERNFFRPHADEGLLPDGFLLPLPADWQGDIALTLHARAGMRLALHPRVLHEDAAMQLAHRSIALESIVYAGLFVLALLALALYSAARDRSFLALFASGCSALLLLAAENGHLYLLPGLSLLSAWREAGLWVFGLLFTAAALNVLLRYAGLRGEDRIKRVLDGCCIGLVALAAVFLLDLRSLDAWLPPIGVSALIMAAVGMLCVLAIAARRGAPMANAMLLLGLLIFVAALARAASSYGQLADVLATRFGYQLALVVAMAVLMVGLISRIGEFRDQRDRDHLARVDSERRMAREAARADFTLALHTRLRAPETADIEWIAFRLLLERLLPHVPVRWAAVVAYGYHGQDLLVAEPIEYKQAARDAVASRTLALKRLAQRGMALQQAAVHGGEPCIEAFLPLPIRAPGWGALLLQRLGSEGFSTEEMSLAGEFARLAALHADESLASAQLRRSAEFDALTGTLNRRTIDQWLARSFTESHRKDRPLSLLFIDIDHFKSVNDRLGHAGGDHCLRQVAAALRGALGSGDMLGRYGGEEFVVLLPGRVGADAREMGERLRAAVERCAFAHDGQPERLTVSIGVATRLDSESTPAAAVKRADDALYAAKHAGRNCVRVAPAVFT